MIYGRIGVAALAVLIFFTSTAASTPIAPHALLAAEVIASGASTDSAAAAGKAGEHEADANPLEFKSDLALWTAVVFLVLMFLLWKFAWGPLSEGLDKRERHIADQITQAHEANQKAKDLLAGYEKKLADSQDEVRAILENGRRDAEHVGSAIIDKAKADAKAEAQRMLKQIDAATAKALMELADRSASMAVDLAGKILHARLNPKDHAWLIEQAVAGFTEREDEPSRN